MKNTRKSNRIVSSKSCRQAALAALATVISIPTLYAAGGAWNVDAAGNWSTTTNWTPAAVPGTAAGDVVDLLFNITAARIITIDTTSRTVGDLNIGDPTATLFGYTLASSAGTVVLNLDGTGAADATVDFRSNIGNTISAPLTLIDNAIFRSNVAAVQTLSGVIAGTGKTVTFNNDTDGTVNAASATNGQFLVTGNNTYTGGTTISDVRVNITTNNTALGAAGSTVTIQNGGQMYASTALATINYAFNIAGNGWVETATGQPFGALRLEGGSVVTGNVAMSANAGIGGNGTGTVNGIISGVGFALSKRGSGTLILGGANTYSGGTNVSGILQLNNNTAAGTGTISIDNTTATGTNTLFATRVLVNGGVTIANNFQMLGATTGTAGFGVLQQTGTGLATVNGTMTIAGSPSAGGHFVGGAVATNALVLGGQIVATVPLSHRDGFVRYSGGGTGYTSLNVTGTAQVGATNGISTVAAMSLGGAASSALDLNGFDQTLASVSVGNATLPYSGTVSLGAKTLTLNGDFTAVASTGASSHTINGTAGGTLSFGATPRNLAVNDNPAFDDLAINGAAISAAGGVTKTGTGTLALNGATISGALTVGAGTLAAGTFTSAGTATMNALTFGAGATTLRMKVGPGGDLFTVTNAGGLITSGTTTVNLNQLGGIVANGTYNLINYSGASPGLGGFTLSPVGHAAASLIDTGTAIALQVTGNDRVVWDGTTPSAWNTATANWKLQSNLATPANYIESDEVIFQDSPFSSTVDIAANVMPSKVSFTNTVATTYTVTGAGGIIGTAGLTKTGNGTVILRTQNSYAGATTISEGTLDLDHDATGNLVLTGTSGVSVALGATLKLSRDDGNITFSRNISGAGTVVIDPHTAAGAAARDVAITGNNTGFTGLWKLSPSNVGVGGLGSMRTSTPMTPTSLGSAAVQVDNGGQLWVAGNTFTNTITITGTGFAEAAGGTPVSLAAATTGGVYLLAGTAPFTYGGIGAIRMDANALFSGNVIVNGTAKIGPYNVTGTIAGNVSGTGASDMLVVGGGTAANTLIATGAISVPRVLVNGGATTGNQTLQIGNNGTAGSISTPDIILYGSAAANGVLRMNRSDGYTFTGQTIRGGAAITADLVRTFFIVNSTGTGVTLNNSTLDLSDGANGGNVNVGGNGGTAGVAGSILNIIGTSTVDTGYFAVGDVANTSGTVNQSGTTAVSWLSTLRLGHYPTETGTYNLSGGTLSTATAAPGTFPYAAAGGEQNGGIYVGIDGTGVLNHSGGTITTNFMVLDNRGDTGAGANMGAGIDTYALSSTGVLVLKNAFGVITRNATTAVNLNGGTIQAAAGISPNLDSAKITVQAGGVTLDTNGANTFTLYGPLAGTGTVAVTGGGTFRMQDSTGATATAIGGTGAGNGGSLGAASVSIGATSTLQANRTGLDIWTGAISGAGALVKQNSGTLQITGNGSGYTGTATVSGGRLDVPANFAATTINVSDGAGLGGEPTIANVSLGTATGSNLFINGVTAGALTATNLTLTGTTTVDFSVAPAGPGPVTVLNYTGVTGGLTFALANAANYRPAVFDTSTAGTVTLNLTTKNLTWTGAASTAWNINSAINWNDTTPSPDVFFSGDTVIFPEGGANPSVVLTGPLSPFGIAVNASTTAYTFTSTAGNQITGSTGITKTNGGTLTLTGANAYSGQTSIGGGTVVINGTNSIGSGAVGNNIAISGGGRLSYNNTTALDLGVNRSIAVGAGGGSISHNSATAATITVPGNLTGSGSDNLSFHSAAAGGGTFVLTGDNSGYTAKISVDSGSTGLTTLRIGSQSAAPAGGSITLNFPAAGATGNATTLDLPGITLPAGVTLNMTSLLNGAISLRTQVTGSGASAIAGPVTFAGTSIVQFTTTGTLTYGGSFTETTPGAFNSTLFFRGAGTHTLNGNFNLPTAGTVFAVTDGATAIVNTTGNTVPGVSAAYGTIRLGASNAFGTTATLSIGQAADQAATLDMNGSDHTFSTLSYAAPTTGKGISNTHPTATSNLTVVQAADTTFLGVISGRINLVKDGGFKLTLTGTNTYVGSTSVLTGVLALGNIRALGAAGNAVTIANGATLDVGGQAGTGNRVTVSVSGAGVSGQAAIWNSGGGVTNSPIYSSITLTGDASIGGVNRYDMNGGTGGTTFNGGAFTLTKVGANELWWAPNAGATVGNIVIDGGIFGVQSNFNLGVNTSSIVVNPAGTLYTYSAVTNDKPIIINGGIVGANFQTGTWTGAVTLNGAGTSNRFGPLAGTQVTLQGQVSGAGFEKTQPGVLELQSAANDWLGDTKVTAGTVRVSGAGILSTSTTLDMNGGIVDLNATAQNIAGLKGAAGNLQGGGTLGIAQSADTTYGGTITGTTVVTKSGIGSLTLGAANAAWTGNLSVTGGTVAASAINGGLGSFTTAGRTISASGGSTISLTMNNIFGSGVANLNMPAISLDASTLTSTRYNAIGNIVLNSGALLTQAATDGPGAYEGYQFVGTVTVGGTSASSITTTNGRADHLGANTAFAVAETNIPASTDLLVSAPLKDPSADFGGTGALTKSGNGKMELTGVNTYAGGTTINGGILNVNADTALGAAAGAVAISGGATLQAGGTVSTTARTLTLVGVGGSIDTNGNAVTFGAGSTVTGTALTKSGNGALTLAGTQTYSTLNANGGVTNVNSALGTGTSTLNANATTNINASQTLAALSIGAGVEVTFGDGMAFAGGPEKFGAPALVPEPGSMGLLLVGALGFLSRRRRVE